MSVAPRFFTLRWSAPDSVTSMQSAALNHRRHRASANRVTQVTYKLTRAIYDAGGVLFFVWRMVADIERDAAPTMHNG